MDQLRSGLEWLGGNVLPESFSARRSDGKIELPGVDMGGLGAILAENDTHIAVGWPGHTCWVARFSPRKYCPALVVIYRKEMRRYSMPPSKKAYEYLVPVIEWESRRKPESLPGGKHG